MTYDELKKLHQQYFSLGYINTDVNSKFALISLICYLTNKAKKKRPGVTVYQIVTKLSEGFGLPEEFIVGFSIVCEDFMYFATEFPTFNLEEKQIIPTVKNLLKQYMPF